MMRSNFLPMHKILSEGKSGKYTIKKKRITKQDVKDAEMRSIFNPHFIPPEIGTLMVLGRKSDSSWKTIDVVMSDAEFEKITNRDFMRIATGNILIAGLGIGMILAPLLKDKSVKKITVVEKEKDIIKLIYDKIKKHDKTNKLELIHSDIFDLDLPKEQKFDVIYFDIWDNVCGDNYEQMKNLKKKFRKNRAVGSTVLCWEEETTKDRDRE